MSDFARIPTASLTRLAPSPTGALHLGNARTFLVNWALARQRGWEILLRIEDLDTPRVKPGVIDLTIDLLRWLGVGWDRGPIIQSHDLAVHTDAMRSLVARGCAYPCAKSRSQIMASASSAQSAPQEGSGEVVFPASLRPAEFPCQFDGASPAWRFATPEGPVCFVDECAGAQRINPAKTIGDFVVWSRRDPVAPGQPAYQLAVVVDDARQGVSHIVRGNDLLDSAGRQLLLYRALSLAPEPAYCHLPLVRGPDGKRLAKRHGDTRLDVYRAQGVAVERIIGLVAWWSGVFGPPERCVPKPLSASEFLGAFDIRTMPRADTVFTPKEHAWLMQGSERSGGSQRGC